MRAAHLGLLTLALLLGQVSTISSAHAAVPADAGQAIYDAKCASCHGPNLAGTPGGPSLTSEEAKGKLLDSPQSVLLRQLSETMPPGEAGSISNAAYMDVLEFVLRKNGIASTFAGAAPARPAAAAASEGAARTPARPGPPLDAIAREAQAKRAAFLAGLRPVTDELLRNPPDGAWLNPRRTYDGQGYSPLDQINRGNVAKLQPAWAWQLAAGTNEITPLVHDGVIFVASSATLDALDATTGDLLWRYVRDGNVGVVRNLAIYGDLIYFAAETTMVALDMRTGKVVWEHLVAPARMGNRLGAGPIAAKGKLFQGIGFCTIVVPGACFIAALDAKTGQEVWRFNTIAGPGEPGGDTWFDTPADKRSGGSIWMPGSYDPQLDLLFFGTGQTYQIKNLIRGTERAAGLYTDTTLALNPDTGKLV